MEGLDQQKVEDFACVDTDSLRSGELGTSNNDNTAISLSSSISSSSTLLVEKSSIDEFSACAAKTETENLDEMIENLESILAASQEISDHDDHQSSLLTTFEQDFDCGGLPICEAQSYDVEDDFYSLDFPLLPPPMDSSHMVESVWPSDAASLPSNLPNLESSTETLSNIFVKWLKDNSDRVTIADLKKIKLKTSTIEAATRRLGGGRKGMTELLKLILTWIENHQLPSEKRQRTGGEVSGEAMKAEGYGASYSTVVPTLHNRAPDLQTMEIPALLQFPTYKHVPASSYMAKVCTTQPLRNERLWHTVEQAGPVGSSAMEDASVQNCTAPCNDTRTAASTRAARRSRMARQRWSIRHARNIRSSAPAGASSQFPWPSHHLLPPAASSFHSQPFTSHGFDRHLSSPRLPKANKQYDRNLRLLLQKELKQSDVGNLGRIVLPKKEAELNLPYLASRDGLNLVLEDWCCCRIWNMRYRFWPNNKSRMYLLENAGEFVKLHRMEEGDHMMLYVDTATGNFVIRGVKVSRQGVSSTEPDKSSSSSSNTGKGRSLKSAENISANKSDTPNPGEMDGLEDSESCKNPTPPDSFSSQAVQCPNVEEQPSCF